MMELLQRGGPDGLLVVGLGLVFLGSVVVQAVALRRLDLTRLILGTGALVLAAGPWGAAHGMSQIAAVLPVAAPDQRATMLVMSAGIAAAPPLLSFMIVAPGGVLAGAVLTLRAHLAPRTEAQP